MWFSVSVLVGVAIARLSIWQGTAGMSPAGLWAARSLTIAIGLLGVGFALQAHPFDHWLDGVVSPPLGENFSDLLHVLAIMTACVLLGLVPLRRPEWERWRRPWIGFGVVMMGVAVLASRWGARALAGAHVYQDSFAALVVACCVLVASTTVAQLNGARLLVALTFAAVAGLLSAGVTIYTTISAPEVMVKHYDTMLTVTSIPVAVGVGAAGLYGVWRVWKRGVGKAN